MRFRQSLAQKIQELACRVQVLGGDPVDKCVVRASVIRAHDDVVLGAPLAKQYYATTMETRDLDTMGLEMKARGRKRLCSVKAEAPEMHSCGGLPPGVVW